MCTYVCCRCYIINTKIFLYIYHPAFCGVISHIQNTVDKSLQFLFAKGKRLARNVSHFFKHCTLLPPIVLGYHYEWILLKHLASIVSQVKTHFQTLVK